ncbi:hypothetical protein [Psychroserpens damuponensis]|uniref:hypothetical protein n=1 Tax=Psychroserpens damuponensis TaxID=943936 RepID=UPI00058B7A8E|nr:hypothetical protein [Psychroserpens damuponensis]
MAPIKFEENIKEKLEKRTIQPSIDAWDTLSADLNTHNKRNKKSLIFYIGIAASVIGVLFVTSVLFNASENQLGEPTIVETNTKEIQNNVALEATQNSTVEKEVVANISEEKNTQENNKKDIKSSIKNEPKLATASKQSIHKKVKHNNQPLIEEPLTIVKDTKHAVAALNSVNTQKEKSSASALTFEEVKVDEVINQIKTLELKNGTVTDAEIENLLKQAERDILRDRIYNETTRTVDADALLQDVEDDLEQSFRTRVFEGLKSGFESVKTAVAERNN